MIRGSALLKRHPQLLTCFSTGQVDYYKRRLLYVVAGLDRGFAANGNAAAEVEASVFSLTSASSPVVLSWESGTFCVSDNSAS